jgi:hypothetical protein
MSQWKAYIYCTKASGSSTWFVENAANTLRISLALLLLCYTEVSDSSTLAVKMLQGPNEPLDMGQYSMLSTEIGNFFLNVAYDSSLRVKEVVWLRWVLIGTHLVSPSRWIRCKLSCGGEGGVAKVPSRWNSYRSQLKMAKIAACTSWRERCG